MSFLSCDGYNAVLEDIPGWKLQKKRKKAPEWD